MIPSQMFLLSSEMVRTQHTKIQLTGWSLTPRFRLPPFPQVPSTPLAHSSGIRGFREYSLNAKLESTFKYPHQTPCIYLHNRVKNVYLQ